ncbi:hypothetical protein Nepgr_018507 [Nepenthes gracilis]|uniref:Remorin C-terminal domain-containing protein n=1 Tax=Nepenthes gracilis TaxID=150966 RepID=A0AAD3XUD7_NEPGR|nr:hypothetical protein Nepgr_018507 [Nepenthes gracilis]
MKKGAVSSRKSGKFSGSGTPNNNQGGMGINKGWSSERVPLSKNANRRQVGAALMPFNTGRTLPSKWEDAERWILNPVPGGGVIRPLTQQPRRRPKSKSGPLGSPGIAYYSQYSPTILMYEGSKVNCLIATSSFSAGVIAADGLSIHSAGRDSGVFTNRTKPCIVRSASVHACTDLFCQSSLITYQDENVDDSKDAATSISRAVSRRDVATQMSPVGITHSFPRRTSYFSPSTPTILPITDMQSFSSSKEDIRDIQVVERVTLTRWTKKHKSLIPGKASEDVDNWKLKAVEASSAGQVSKTEKTILKTKREESKIIAWENLQKPNAEKRSSSMNKIMNKLRSAQKKAQEISSTLLPNQSHQVNKTSYKAMSFPRARQMGSLSSCLTSYAL